MADEEKRPQSAGAISKPSDRKDWAQKTNVNMSKARSLARDMAQKLRENDIAEAANKMAAMENANREKEMKKKQVYKQAAKHGEVIGTSFRCMQDIEEVILQTEDSISKLRHEKYAGFAMLQVCQRRLDLRESRPVAETFQDKLQEALLTEKKLLEAARNDIEKFEAEGHKIIEDVTAKRAELSRDTGERRLEMAHDFSSLRHEHHPDEIAKPPPPASALLDLENNGAAAEGGEAGKEETKKPEAPKEETKKAEAPKEEKKAEAPKEAPKEEKKAEAPKEEKKAEAPKEGNAPAEEGKEASKDPQARQGIGEAIIAETNALLERAAEFRGKSLQSVEDIKLQTKQAARITEDCLARRTHELASTKKKLEAHALDVDAAIKDAERALTRTEKRLDPRDTKKKAKLDSDKALLNQLKDSRVILSEDIRNKFAALEIDNMCRRVTPAKADAAKRDKPQRSNSSPSLRTTKDTEFGSTAASTNAPADHAPAEMESTKLPPIEGASKS